MPTSVPRTTPEVMNPATTTQGGVGETSISSMFRTMNLAENMTVATLANEFVTTASITSPGTTKLMYGTEPMLPIRPPRNEPKIRK